MLLLIMDVLVDSAVVTFFYNMDKIDRGVFRNSNLIKFYYVFNLPVFYEGQMKMGFSMVTAPSVP